MKKILLLLSIAAFAFTACEKKGGEEEGKNGPTLKVKATEIAGLGSTASDEVRLYVTRTESGKETETVVATAKWEDGFEITFPKTLQDNLLKKASEVFSLSGIESGSGVSTGRKPRSEEPTDGDGDDDGDDEIKIPEDLKITISKPNALVSEDAGLNIFKGDKKLGELVFGDAKEGAYTRMGSYVYAKEDMDVTASHKDDKLEVKVEMKFKAGWNLTYYSFEINGSSYKISVTTAAVAGLKWHFEE